LARSVYKMRRVFVLAPVEELPIIRFLVENPAEVGDRYVIVSSL
jgi:hypothetical protein